MLLENGITQALRDGDVPKEAVQAMERYQSAQAVRLEEEFQAFMAVEGHPPAKSRRTAAELLQMLEPRLQPKRLRQLLQNAMPELRQAHSDLADDDFKAMVLMALDEGVELPAD